MSCFDAAFRIGLIGHGASLTTRRGPLLVYRTHVRLKGPAMAKNTGKGYREGEVRDRSQVYNPVAKRWTKRDAETGEFMDVKEDREPFKGVRKEH